jgi:retron-type reverse transcriptase
MSNVGARISQDEMPQRVGHLFENVIDFENLTAAYHAARKGKRYRREVADYAVHLEENLINLQNHLLWKTWEPGHARRFTVYEPKQRDIQAPPFEDRIVHHALVRIVEPLFERRFIYHSYACRKGKGAQRAVQAVQQQVRIALRSNHRPYALKADIRSYFASISHSVLRGLIERVVKDRDVLGLWDRITAGYECDGVGLPVGALTSQLSANIVLDALDHAMVDEVGMGARYVRYMDDVIVVCPDKDTAHAALTVLTGEAARLGLAMNPKTHIFPTHCGIDFCGYRIWATHILPRKRNTKKARKQFRRMAKWYANGIIDLKYVKQRVASLIAYAKHCSARTTTQKILDENIFVRRPR